MILLDTNIFIYLANGTLPAKILPNEKLAYASIVKIESLGYSKIMVGEQSYLNALFDECLQVDLTENIIQTAITLRQQHDITLGDAITAATALECECELWTANTADFKNITDLRLRNPLQK